MIRDYQSKQLYEDFKLTPLYIYRTAISKSFKNQVMARLASERSQKIIIRCAHYEPSPNYQMKVPLIVVFHDP